MSVLDVQINDGAVSHKVGSPLEVGKKVSGKLDFALRFSRMQRHSGEHILLRQREKLGIGIPAPAVGSGGQL